MPDILCCQVEDLLPPLFHIIENQELTLDTGKRGEYFFIVSFAAAGYSRMLCGVVSPQGCSLQRRISAIFIDSRQNVHYVEKQLEHKRDNFMFTLLT